MNPSRALSLLMLMVRATIEKAAGAMMAKLK
jgi:hypothetical protein